MLLLNLIPTTAALLSWSLQTTLLMGAGWALYHFALRRERFFGFNCRFLLLLPWLALLAPPLLATTTPALTSWLQQWRPSTGPAADLLGGGLLPALMVSGAATGQATIGPLPWLVGIYLAGVALLLLRLAAHLLQLHRSTRNLPREAGPDYVLVRTGGQQPVSSFGRLIFWDETARLTPAEARAVLAHELAHVRGHHTRQRLLLEVARALLWPVPFVHCLPPALAQLHEFLADAEAVQVTGDAPTGHRETAPTAYPALLARLALGQFQSGLPLAHSFTQSFTLTRIRMLTTSAPLRRWKRWLPLPVAALALLLVACEQTQDPAAEQQNKEQQMRERVRTVTVTSPNARALPVRKPGDPYSYVDQMPQYEGGSEQILADLDKNLKYPSGALAAKIEGRAFVKFAVGADGKIQSAEVQKSVATDKPGTSAELTRQLDEAALYAVRNLPGKWTPGRQNGEAVSVYFSVPITFSLK